MKPNMNYKSLALGGFYGLAVGDAIGAQVEFKQPGTFPPVIGMIGGGPFNLKPGQTTDDTSMAILMAQSLDEKNGFDPEDMMNRFLEWYESPDCFDIGHTIKRAIEDYKYERNPFQGIEDDNLSGNGSIMRIYPSLLWTMYMPDQEAFKIVWDITRLTHASKIVKKETEIMFHLVRRIVRDMDLRTKQELLADIEIPSVPKNTGFVTDTLQAALWCFKNSTSFDEGLLKVVNLGGDADTIGAVYGQIAGAWYGHSGIPTEYLEKIEHRKEINRLALMMFAPNRPKKK